MSSLDYICSLKDTTPEEKQKIIELLNLVDNIGPPNINHRSRYDRTPLHYACVSGNVTAVNYLFQVSNNIDPDNELEVNAKTKGGETPLMLAAENNNPQICSILLLTFGADPFLKDSSGIQAY